MSNPLIKLTLLGAIAFIALIFVATKTQPVQASGQVPVFTRTFPNVAPVKLYGGSNSILRSFAPTVTVVNAGPDVDAANNNYRRIQDALNSAVSGDTIILNGIFDFTEANAAAAWALGNDNTAGTADDYEVLVPVGLSNVTLTANNLGDATIQGPGDLAGVNLEGFLVFDSFDFPGAGQGWTISNLQIFDFDLSIGMFAGAATDYNNTTIQNNLIRIATDLNATVAPVDVNQNIGIHLSFGTNQTVSGNTIQIRGNGVSDSANSNFSSEVGLQSSTSGGSVYDGLTISANFIHVLNAQSADPENILGIWENSHGHTGNVTIAGNSFLNDAAGNNSSLNLQRAFRVTSHSGASSLVKYDSNIVNGANLGFQWIAGSNFTGNQAVVLTGNQITNSNTGVLIQSNGIAHFENNVIIGSGSGGGIRLTTGTLAGSPATFPANSNGIYRTVISGGSGDGVWIEATAGSVAPLSQNDLSGNANFGLRNEAAPSITAENNWWGNNLSANVLAKISGNADSDPWLASGTDVNAAIGFQPFTYANTSGTITTFVGTAAADTGSLLAGDPITMTMNGDTATTPLAQLLNFDIQLGGSDDVFTLGQTGIPTVFDGGAGNDTLVGTNFPQTWNITAAGSGNIPGATSSFSSVETLRGGTAADSFIFGASGTISQIVNGDLGSDTLDNSAIPGHTITPGGAGSLDGRTGSATGVGLSFDNINNFFPSPSSVTGTKTVTGTFAPNGSITYTVVLTNSSAFAQLDNPGNEFTDVLPAGLTLVSAIANSGTAVANTGTNTVTWAGSIANGASVTVTINATINGNAGGTTISNQGTINYDADGNGTNEATSLTDDPSTGAANDPTAFSVCPNNLIVTTNADSGPNSLRQAIVSACSGATITFDMNQVVSPITLTTGQLVINKNLTITGPAANLLTISGNNASRIFNVSITSPGIVTISGLTFANGNSGPVGTGGGISNSSTGTLNVISSTVRNNDAGFGGTGGGISNSSTGTLNVIGSTLNNNNAGSAGGSLGGGIYNNTSGTVNVINSTLSANNAGSGGGMLNQGTGTIRVVNSTISGNTAGGSGGGLYNQVGGPFRLRNTIVALNTGNNDLFSSFISDGHNLIGANNGSTGFTNGVNGDIVGTIAAPVNPRLSPLASNGGETQTFALMAGSPALDAGDNCVTDVAHCGDANIPQLTTDQRGGGFARLVDGPDADAIDTVDIGAFEAQLWLEDITDKATNEDTQLQFTFNVGGSAGITSVTATSSDTTLVPNNAANIDVSGSGSTRTLTINPVANLSGTSTITVTVTGTSGTMTDTFVLTVNPVNDVPSFIKGPDQTVNEDSGAQSAVSWATSISPGPNEAGQTVSFTATNNNNTLFSVQPAISSTGTLTYTPAANANGSATVSVTLKDNGGTANGGVDTSALQTFTITVIPLNDAPSFTKGADQTVNEDAGATTVNSWATAISAGPANESGQTLTFQVTGISNPSLFSAVPAISPTGTLTYTPAANANGSATISINLKDNGGTANGGVDTSAGQSFTITVNPVADTPSITNATTPEDTQTALGGLVISRNAADSAEVTHFKITNIQNGTLFKNNGNTQINNGDFITFAEGNAGLRFTPGANLFSPGTTFSFQAQASLNNTNAGLGGGLATATISVGSVADTPSVTNATTTVNTQTTSGLVITRNAGDGPEVTHFKITNLQNGTLFKNNGTTQINNGDFITFAEGNAGLKFTPATNLSSPATTFRFEASASLSNSNAGLSAGTATATITVNCGPAVVTSNADNGPGSLRAVINSACAGSVITFDMNQVISPITLTSGELLLDHSLTLQGPGANVLTVQRSAAAGTPLFSIFTIFNQSLTTNISGLTISNADSTANGGAIRNGGTLAVSGVTFSNNHTIAGGAAIFNGGTGVATITNCTISGNRADEFAAVYNQNGTLTISNSTLNGNTNVASFPGAAIFSDTQTSVTNVTNCTISQNSGTGGAVFQNPTGAGVVNLKNSIVSGNTGSDTSGITDNGNNIIGGAPLLAPLGNYGGPTQTMALLPGSPAINAGASTGAPTTDQRGISRVGAVDIGAFESRGFTIAATSGSGQTTPILTAFALPLTATVSSAFSEPVTGGLVTFNAPASGASSTFPGNVTSASVSINATGAVVLAPTANGIAGGPYDVVAALGTGQPIVNFALTNAKANQTITFGSLPNKITGDPDFSVSATASSGLAVSFATSGQCTIAGTTVHLTGAGSCTITASQTGNSVFNAAPDVPRTFNIAKANQTITFGSLPNKIAGDPDFSVSATASSGLAVSFATSGQCTIAGTTVHLTGAGSCTITASQAGNSDFNAAPDVPRTFNIAKANQTITFGSLPNKLAGDPDFSVSATASSGLAVGFAASGQCTIAGTTVHLTGAGSCTITASQAGNSDFNAAPDVPRAFNIAGPLVSLSQTNYNVNESAGFVVITVNRAGNLSVPVTVEYATSDTGSSNICSTVNSGLAAARCDFGLILGTLNFAAAETQKTFVIPITQDSFTEGPETFTVSLSNVNGNGTSLATPSSATVTINDSAAPAANASDDTDAFVRQQYRDFLNREADPAGLAFWKNNIDKCNDPAQRPAGQSLVQCIEVQRILTSGAFFLSIEFQQTGVFVRDFYVAALNRPVSGSQPLLVEFLRDVEAVQSGVVVGVGNWQQVLNNNRTAFMNDFVMRTEFAGLYPTTDTPAQYVDKLYQHAAVTGTAEERVDAIAEFNGATTASDPGARARALLRITQNGAFRLREGNRAFVFMEYIGYLRRSPNDPPDGNFDGYNFWLTKLNQFNGDFLQAEMVKAFLSSIEYRQRFGQ